MADIERVEPSADTRAFAQQTRQVFVALLLEGFTEFQALHIIGVMLAAAARNQEGEG